MLKRIINNILCKLGYKIEKIRIDLNQYDADFIKVYNECAEYTMSSIDRMYALYQSVNYIVDNNIQGDIVECGVWRGGSAMIIAKTLINRGIIDRKIHLFDTYEGMTEPTEEDRDKNNNSASELMKNSSKKLGKERDSIWCIATIEDVSQNIENTGYPKDKLVFIKGKVEDTLLKIEIEKIAILRLDTDWYESTKIEMEILFPKLVQKGILIIDDYGHWQGAKKAIDDYFSLNKLFYLMYKLDYTGRLIVKI